MAISRLQQVPLRDLWKHEAHGFTRWLVENLDLVGEKLGFDLTLVEREARTGPFSADILAEDSDGNYVIIENQLEQTNHDHLGKLITYLSNLDAKKAIWITSEPRPEHEKAIHWLNETLPADTAFFLIKLEAYKINDSDPAPLLTIVAGPSPEGKQVGAQKKELAERHVLRLEFWRQLIDRAKTLAPSLANRSPSKDNWIATSAGKSGFGYNYIIRMDDAQIELYIDRGDAKTNKDLFETLLMQKEQIERSFGKPLDWQRLDEKQSCRVRYVLEGAGLLNQDKWSEIQERMIDEMIKFQKAIQPVLNQMK
jgi:hypothetical protein